MKNLITFFIKYPVSGNVLMAAVFIFGMGGLMRTKSSFFPLSDSNIININVSYPGASPAEIEEGVVLKIEDNLRGLVGIDRVTSVSRENLARITVEAFRDADINVVLADVKNAVDRVPSFPVGMEPAVVSKFEMTNNAISFTVSGDDIPLKTMKEIARGIEKDLRSKGGISQIELKGFPDEEIEIAVRENDLRAFNLTFDEVARAVANANLLTTGGNIKTSSEEYLIRANNRNYHGQELDFITVRADPSGNIIRLRDVATVRDKWSESPDRLSFNGKQAVQVLVSTTNSEDLTSAAEFVRQYIKDFNQSHENVHLDVNRNESKVLEDRIDLLLNNGGLGILLVLVLLSLFLKPSIALWVAVGLPFSMFGLFILAPSFMTINVVSLFGMILVIGILVDDGIVIGENAYHHYQKGKTPIQAAIDGTIEVVPPIVSAILTTLVAFTTFYFLPGVIGTFFGEISTVVILILSISLIEAILILPSHLAHSRALKKGTQTFLLNRWSERAMDWMRDHLYMPALRFFLENKILGFAIPTAFLIITIGAIRGGIIKFQPFPPVASEEVSVQLRMPEGTSEAVTDSIISIIEEKAWKAAAELSKELPGGKHLVTGMVKRIGTSIPRQSGPVPVDRRGGSTSEAVLTMYLLPGEERPEIPAFRVSEAVSKEVGEVYGVESLEYNSGNTFGGKPISISLISSNIDEIKAATEYLKERMSTMTQLTDISDNDPEGIKEIRLQLKENAYLLGLNLNSVMAQVRSGFFGRSVQRFQRGQDEIRVWVRYDKADRRSINDLDDMRIVTPTGSRVPLSEIADYTIARGVVSINHLDGNREIRVEANQTNFKDSSSDLLSAIQADIIPDVLERYPSVSALYEGQNREFGKLGGALQAVLPFILLLMYIIIAFTFRSYSQPVLLLLMIPFSLVGVAWGHWMHDMPLNMLSMLGVVALIGILVNDGLVLIGKFNSRLKEGYPFKEALLEAGKSRFRAIFLTSITTVAGLAPLILAKSFSAQFLIPMAISVAYGISYATFLTLLMLPMMLSVINYLKLLRKWLATGEWVPRESLERAVREISEQ
ncbi:MAG TPA: efflux RND transporter permease subunit [Bacteroidetes bacterium]|nr:efflux RND transporter permease subunit [Bacteroidota bacterium]